MNHIQYKDLNGDIVDVDEQGRKVVAVWSKMGNVDLDNDLILPGAFNKTIAERGPNGKNLIWALTDHKASMSNVLGKPSELREEGDQLIATTSIVDTPFGNDVLKFYASGMINQHSIGYGVVKWDWMDSKQDVRQLKELKLYEGSAVLWGANPETPMLDLIKGMTKKEKKEQLCQRLEKFCKSLKHGTFTDETFSLIEIEIKQIQKAITELDTPPADEAVEPLEDKQLLDALSTLYSKL